MNTVLKAVILGAPGSGKGTISNRIIKAFNMEYISSGDRLRQNIKEKTAIGLEATKYINDGKLLPDDLMIKFITEELSKVRSNSWLLDGFPRTLQQAQQLWKRETLDLAINLVVPFSVILERVEGRMVHLPSGRAYNSTFNIPKNPGFDDVTGEPLTKREDDKPEVVKKRLAVYEEMTRPVIEFYREQGILKEFHGETSDAISPQVINVMSGYIKQAQKT
ncbi:unnamed protein product [Phyllotreta striolata]|uniref:GTP:AMP phosphotransferase, mitochondrial n=1 Tax=Phyllotreta striolata TaxID=444603 RepID=A0A9N9XUY1_PHYSR|nr:unnamed protein product [Phyllotreta striolata]